MLKLLNWLLYRLFWLIVDKIKKTFFFQFFFCGNGVDPPPLWKVPQLLMFFFIESFPKRKENQQSIQAGLNTNKKIVTAEFN